MDQDVINLAKAIRQKESGGNFSAVGDAGTSKGGYQWQPATWKEHSKKILGKEGAEMTPDNQNAVAYGMIKTWKDQGLNPAQIAAKWNSGQPNGWENKVGITTINGKKIKYNVPAYVKEVTDIYQSLKTPTSTAPIKTPSQLADEASAEKYGATFASKSEGTPLGEAARTVGNIPKSGFNFAKGMLDIINPVSTFGKIKEIVKGTKEFAQEQGGYGKALGLVAKELPGTAYESMVPEAARSLIKGDIDTARRAIVNDPFGQIAPFVLGAKGLAKGADAMATKSAMKNYVKEPYTTKTIPKPTTTFNDAFETGMSKTAGLVTKPLGYVGSKVGGSIASATRAGIAQATGLNRETVPQIIKSPEAFTKKSMAQTDRASIGKQVQSELGKLAEEKTATGKSYEPIRKSTTPIKVDGEFFDNTIKETTGLKIKKGQLIADTNSKIRDPGDIRALQKVYDLWGKAFKKGELTTNEYLNLREDLAKAAKFEKDIGVRKDVQILSGQIRAKLNEAYRPQVSGLKDLDATMSEQIAQYKELARGLVDRDGTITDAGMAKIANLSKNKPNLAIQLEKILPGITEQVKNLQAIVDIERASGIKVGTYAKGAIIGGGLAFGGPIQAIINLILTSPQLAVPILRQYGLLKNSAAVKAVMTALKEGGKAINNPEATLSPYMTRDITTIKPKIGLGIEDVSKGNYLYHGTSAKNIRSISEKGLSPAEGDVTFFTANEGLAKNYGALKKNGESLVLRIDKSKLPPENFQQSGHTAVPMDIPPEALEIKTPDGWKPLNEVKKTWENPSAFSPKGKGVVAPKELPEKVTLQEVYDSKAKLSSMEDGMEVPYREEMKYLIDKGYGNKTINEIIGDESIPNGDRAPLRSIKKYIQDDLATLSKEGQNDILIPSLRNTGGFTNTKKVNYTGSAKQLGLDKYGITDSTIEWVEKWVNRYDKTDQGGFSVPEQIQQQLKSYLPETKTVTLYRGAKKGNTNREFISWSYDKKVAERFANRIDGGEVIKKEIPTEDIVVDFTKIPENLLDKKTRIQEAEVIVRNPKTSFGR